MTALNRFVGKCLLCLTVACGGCATSGGGTQTAGSTKAAGFDSGMKAKIRSVDKIVNRAAKEYRLDPDLLRGMIWVESRFDPKATSPAGAKGLMQLMPATAKSLANQLDRASRPYNSDFNVTAGAYYLRKMLNRYDGNLQFAIAAYNAGPGNVSKWTRNGGRLPTRSRGYVDKVLTARSYFTEKKLRARRMAEANAPTRVIHHEPAPEPANLAQAPTSAVIPAPEQAPATPAANADAPATKTAVLLADSTQPVGELIDEAPVFERRPELDMLQPPAAPAETSLEPAPTIVSNDIISHARSRDPDALPSVLD